MMHLAAGATTGASAAAGPDAGGGGGGAEGDSEGTSLSLVIDFNCWPDVISQYLLHPTIMITLCLLSVFVVLGNLLVMSAIWHENQLHSVTNYLIASLAAADCLVGALVMPFSIISEIILGSWTFGPVWCDLWHSFDVLASTASIMNLCAISLDRYLAITNPISYPRRMTPRRVALLIAFLWTCSSLISFPAIIWWRAVGPGPLQQFAPELPETAAAATPSRQQTSMISSRLNVSSAGLALAANGGQLEQPIRADVGERGSRSDEGQVRPIASGPQYKCVFTDDTYYLLFSSFISFYGPLCVMLYAYYKIYKAAVQQTRFLKHGSKQVMIAGKNKTNRSRHKSDRSLNRSNEKDWPHSGAGNGGYKNGDQNGVDQDRHLVLRVHRGGGANLSNSNNKGSLNGETELGSGGRTNNRLKGSIISKMSSDFDATTALAANETPDKVRCYDVDVSQRSATESDNRTNKASSLRSSARYHFNIKDRRLDGGSKRDIMRVNSQRFDINPYKEAANRPREPKTAAAAAAAAVAATTTTTQTPPMSTTTTMTKTTNTLDLRSTLYCNKSDCLESDSKLNSMNVNPPELANTTNTTINTTNATADCSKCMPPMGKPLLAFINNRSANVDVSVVDEKQGKRLTKGTAKEHFSLATPRAPNNSASISRHNLCDKATLSSSISELHTQKGATAAAAATSNTSSNTNASNKLQRSALAYDIDDISDDIIESGSSASSDSSSSYGTGSVVSVMLKPIREPMAQNIRQPAPADGSNTSTNFTSANVASIKESGHIASSISTKMKRALSFGSTSMQKDLPSRLELHATQIGPSDTTNDGELNGAQVKNGPAFNKKHRASCGEPARVSDNLSGFRGSKSLNIRSWMKLARPGRANKTLTAKKLASNRLTLGACGVGAGGGKQVKPPASLLPLMAMNSDTSTDSSVVTGAFLKGSPGPKPSSSPSSSSASSSTSSSSSSSSSSLSSALKLERSATIEASSYATTRLARNAREYDIANSGAKVMKAASPAKKPVKHVSSCSLTLRLNVVPTDGGAGQVIDKRSSFREDLERGNDSLLNRSQVLYHNSDKLIQSIVDLRAIQYIDCTNGQQPAARATDYGGGGEEMERNNMGAGCEDKGGHKRSLDTPERTHKDTGGAGTGDEAVADSGANIPTPTATTNNNINTSNANAANANATNADAAAVAAASRTMILPRQHRSVGKKLSKLAKERKAAKTLGIVVGVFILCWLPFFVVNIVVALCGTSCVYKPQIFVSIVTWLGWLNSAMNPVIYACWSRDFRRAFRRVLCTWVEFVCPYDNAIIAKKLKLKKNSNFSPQEAYLNRTISSVKGNTSSVTIRSGVSVENRGYSALNSDVSRGLLADQQ